MKIKGLGLLGLSVLVLLLSTLSLLFLRSSAKANEEVRAPSQGNLTAWNPLSSAQMTTLGAGGLVSVERAPALQDECIPDTSAMMSYWPLNETSGKAFTDVVDGNHGACTNCPSRVLGKVQNARSFKYVDRDGIIITEDADNPLIWAKEDSFSFEVWVKFTETCTGNKVFFGRYRSDPLPEATWWVGCVEGGFPTFSLKSDGQVLPPFLTDDVAINDGVWHHVVAVRDAAAGLDRLYVDGVEAINVARSYTTDFTSTGLISIGSYSDAYFFDGAIDEVAVYDKALSATQVAYHYNDGAGQSYCTDAPVAVDDKLSTNKNVALRFAVSTLLANDVDWDGNPLTITDMDTVSTQGGTIQDIGGGYYRYTPLTDFIGRDTFTYTITDGAETDTATVTVTVNPVAIYLPMLRRAQDIN